MSAEHVAELRTVSVGQPEPSTSLAGPAVDGSIPADVVRFAGLPSEQRRLLMHVNELLTDISFGTVVIVMQDGKVIQIETSEKIRLR